MFLLEGGSAATKAVDVFDMDSNTWSVSESLSEARSHLSAASVGNMLMFAGTF